MIVYTDCSLQDLFRDDVYRRIGRAQQGVNYRASWGPSTTCWTRGWRSAMLGTHEKSFPCTYSVSNLWLKFKHSLQHYISECRPIRSLLPPYKTFDELYKFILDTIFPLYTKYLL
ncbi:hypothetical protein Hamer_G014083 [Homarus americanus]|uniref:Uncharacterized protein n=1 Tax=Homarus americanus TaxID=6706 RepID=A0A8J5MS02_HOMAM|nr:hypothetical protein Hamer_G014083 [Homarus americanus]